MASVWAGGSVRADTIQLAPGDVLTAVFAMPGFDPNNPTALFPTTIGLDLVGSVPNGSATAPIPGSTATYYSGILLSGSLQSTNGSNSIALFDADSWRLGLPTGDLVADDTGGDGATVFTSVNVSVAQSEAIFGITGQAEFTIDNLGSETLTIGLGPGYSLANAIINPLSANNGGIQTAGLMETSAIVQSAAPASAVPEPAAFSIAAAGGALVFWLRRRLRP
jgi:hypothetical protein